MFAPSKLLNPHLIWYLSTSISSSAAIHISSISTSAIFEVIVGGSQCGAMVGKAHLLESTPHEVPLPLFGLGYDGTCTFRGAPLPCRSVGQA